MDIANKLVTDKKAKNPDKIKKLIAEKKFNELAMEVGIKVIHCSERDTQISNKPKRGRRIRRHLEHRRPEGGGDCTGRDGLGHA